MSKITIHLSQTVYDTQGAALVLGSGDSIGTQILGPFMLDGIFTNAHHVAAPLSQNGSEIQLTYADDAYANYKLAQALPPFVLSGTATISSIEEYYPGFFSVDMSGSIRIPYSFTSSGGTLSLGNPVADFKTWSFRTLISRTDSNYDAVYGNISETVRGDLHTEHDSLSGTVTSIEYSADVFLTKGTVTGYFEASTFPSSAQSNSLSVNGTITNVQEQYADQSSFTLSDAAIPVDADTVLSLNLLSNADLFTHDDVFDVSLPATLAAPWLLASGAGNDSISLTGGGALAAVDAGSGDDTIALHDFGHSVDGGSGIDTLLLPGARGDYKVTVKDGAVVVHENSTGLDATLAHVERVTFKDGTFAIDVGGNAGEAYRIYQAAFNRAPDAVGLGYWISAMDKGASLQDIAAGFVGSDEFKTLYGSSPSNHDLVTRMYTNVLHRAPDAAGLDYWVGILDNHQATVPQVLSFISESGENVSALAGVIGNGFAYTPWMG
ncbi:MAG: DUF4214 domain-containing protein [Telluria sp.]